MFFRKMMSFSTITGALGVCSLGFVCTGHAEILSYHSFNDMFNNADGTTEWDKENVVGEPTLTMVEAGGALVDGNGVSGTAFVDADGDSHVAGQGATWTATNVGENYWQLDLATTGYEDLALRFDSTHSVVEGVRRGASSVTIAWAIDGNNAFTDVQTFDLNPSYTAYSVDLSSIATIENASSVQLRGTWSNDGTLPNTRLENLQLTGSLIPEPGSLALFGLGCGILAIRSRAS